MNVVPILVLVSLGLAAAAVLLFVHTTRSGTHDHADRLALLPLEDDLQLKEPETRTIPRAE